MNEPVTTLYRTCRLIEILRHILLFLRFFQVLPSEKQMKRNLMKNAIYNEYNVDELETSFKFVSCLKKVAIGSRPNIT